MFASTYYVLIFCIIGSWKGEALRGETSFKDGKEWKTDTATSTITSSSSSWQLVFEDTFDAPDLGVTGSPGGINTSKWSFDYGWQYGNEENQYYTDRARNARVENGTLILEALYENLNVGHGKIAKYTSASIFSKQRYRYGLVEFIAKVPQGGPTHPALWLLGPTDIIPWPWCGEIDVMECVGRLPGIDHGTFHTEWCNGPHGNIGYTATYPVQDMGTQWSNYSVLWTPTELTIYVNGIPYNSYCNDGRCDVATWPYNFFFEIIMDMSVGPKWGSNASSLPKALVVDSVRWYQPVAKKKKEIGALEQQQQQDEKEEVAAAWHPFVCRKDLAYMSLQVVGGGLNTTTNASFSSLPEQLFLQSDDRLEVFYNLTRRLLHQAIMLEIQGEKQGEDRGEEEVTGLHSGNFEGLVDINSVAVIMGNENYYCSGSEVSSSFLLVNFTLLNLPGSISALAVDGLLQNVSSNATLRGSILEELTSFFQNMTTNSSTGAVKVDLESLSSNCSLPGGGTTGNGGGSSSSFSCFLPYQDPTTGLPSSSNFSSTPVGLGFQNQYTGVSSTSTSSFLVIIPAAEYNYGGEGIAYHDTTYWNLFAPPRSQLRSRPEWVDVKEIELLEEDASDGGGGDGQQQQQKNKRKKIIIGWFAGGEWLKYSNILIPSNYSSSIAAASSIPFDISLTAANGAKDAVGEVVMYLERSPNCVVSGSPYPTFCPVEKAVNWQHTFQIPFSGSWVDYEATAPWSGEVELLLATADTPPPQYTITLVIKNPSFNLMSINLTPRLL